MLQDVLQHSMRVNGDEGPLVFCNLPPRKSVSDWEPSRMSYYNGNENFSVPFKWEAAPGKPIVDESAQPDSPECPLQLRPPPSASNSPLHPFVPSSFRDQQKARLPPKFRNYSRPESSYSMSSRSNGNATTADRGTAHRRDQSKGSMSRRSEFDWPEVSDEEGSSTPTMDCQEPPSSNATTKTRSVKNWSFSSSSFSSTSTAQSHSQSPSPVNSGGGARGVASTRDLFLLRNLVNMAAASAAAPANCYANGSARSSTEASDDEDEREGGNDHVRPGRGFLSCMVRD